MTRQMLFVCMVMVSCLSTVANAGESISTTTVHPFYVLARCGEPDQGGHWIAADELAPGDCFLLSDGSEAILRVTESKHREVESVGIDPSLKPSTFNLQPITTYNFEVADHHTYFVGRLGIWVHNTTEIPCGKISQKQAGRMLGLSQAEISNLVRARKLLLESDNETLMASTVVAFAEENGFPMLYPDALSTSGAAAFLYDAVSPRTVHRWLEDGMLSGWGFNGSGTDKIWRILRSDLQEFRDKYHDALYARGKKGAVTSSGAARLLGVGDSCIFTWLEDIGHGEGTISLLAGFGPVYRLPGIPGTRANRVIPLDTLYQFAKVYRFPRRPGVFSRGYNNRLNMWPHFRKTDPIYILDPKIKSIPADWVY